MEWHLWRLVIAGLLGLIIGIISIKKDRTSSTAQVFAIIAMASALITVTSLGIYEMYYKSGSVDPIRLPAQIISALGFLGTGMIWFTDEKGVLGMNSAASLWITAILGMLVGAGLDKISVLGMFFFVLIYWFSQFIQVNKNTKIKNRGI